IQGLLVAITLGVAGGAVNWLYLTSRSREMEKVAFVGIAVDIQRGQTLREADLVRVEIPRLAVGNLEEFAILYSARQSVVGAPVWRRLEGGSLLLREDLKTPPQALKFGENERVIWIPVDTRTFVPSLVIPGDLVSFLVSPFRSGFPTPADPLDPDNEPPPPATSGPIDIIGPFKILSLGNRLGSAEVMRAARIAQVQENVMSISVPVDAGGNLAPDAEKLMRILNETNFRPVGVMLHPREPDGG
ncbi:MAG: hypothetical protein ACE5JI_22325, partial [Acidobacteriota bacterium]